VTTLENKGFGGLQTRPTINYEEGAPNGTPSLFVNYYCHSQTLFLLVSFSSLPHSLAKQ
jgi:hypothetical protein